MLCRMPQLFQVLKCYKCSVFQVHQTKKSNKWVCKLCGEKQSIKRHYGLGTGKECRLQVQKLNGIRGKIDELSETIELNKNSDEELENTTPNIDLKATEKGKINESKWSNFIEETDCPTPEVNDKMYLENTEVVLEVPVRKRKKFKPPTSTAEPAPSHSYELNDPVYNYEPNEPAYSFEPNDPMHPQSNISNSDLSTSNYNTFFKNNPFKVQATLLNSTASIKENSSSSHQKSYKLSNVTNKIKEQLNNQDENHLKVKTYIPPKVNKNSKWAQFADESDENEQISRESSMENALSGHENFTENKINTNTEIAYRERPIDISQSKANSSENVPKHLFALCNENELDDVLEF